MNQTNITKLKYSGKTKVLTILLSLLPSLAGQAGESPERTREALREWVGLENEISREANAWAEEKEILKDQIKLLETEKERLQKRIREAEEGLDELDTKRVEMNERRGELKAAVESIRKPLELLEKDMLNFYQRLPEPLKEETRKLYERIPKGEEKTGLAITARLQAVVGLLNFADKFNGGILREVEIRNMEGRQREVETLYFGLAGAYFADKSGGHAGIGFPATDGWQWEKSPSAEEEITALIEIYKGTREAAFSPVPASITSD